MKNQQALKAMTELVKSHGWEYMQTIMNNEILQSAYQIADNPEMTTKEIDFRRGALWAAKQLLNLPDKLLMQLENEVVFEDMKVLDEQGRNKTG